MRHWRSPAALLPARTVDLLLVDLPAGRGPAIGGVRVGDRLGRLAALARRAGTLLVVVEPHALGRGLAAGVEEASGLRLELARDRWIRLGRDVVGQRTEVVVARNHFGPPGRRADLQILYADGGARDACLAEERLLDDPHQAPASRRAARAAHHRRPAATPAIELKRPPPSADSHMRLLHLLWPHLPLRLARYRSWEARPLRSFPTGPVVLGGQPWSDGTVLDTNPPGQDARDPAGHAAGRRAPARARGGLPRP